MNLPIYLDNQATTRIDPRVLDAMMPYLSDSYGNAASRSHSFGWTAEQAVETARAQIARLIGAAPKEIVFTSGATESNNLALKGAVEAWRAANPGRTPLIVTQATEHKAVLDPCLWLQKQGCRLTILPVDSTGLIRLDDLRALLDAKDEPPTLVSIMFANNEIGAIQPIAEIGALCREHGVLFHTDAAQAAGKLPIDVVAAYIDLLSISGHKLYAPKGVGVLYVRRRGGRVHLAEQMHGGGHEHGMRSGTLNVPAIVGLGLACEIAAAELPAESLRLAALRDRFQSALTSALDQLQVNGPQTGSSSAQPSGASQIGVSQSTGAPVSASVQPGDVSARRLPGNLNITFRHVDSETLMMGLKDVAISSGSACTSAKIEPSHVLRAIGLDDQAAHSTLRFGLGRFTTEEEIDYVAARLIEVVRSLRELSPAYADAD